MRSIHLSGWVELEGPSLSWTTPVWGWNKVDKVPRAFHRTICWPSFLYLPPSGVSVLLGLPSQDRGLSQPVQRILLVWAVRPRRPGEGPPLGDMESSALQPSDGAAPCTGLLPLFAPCSRSKALVFFPQALCSSCERHLGWWLTAAT